MQKAYDLHRSYAFCLKVLKHLAVCNESKNLFFSLRFSFPFSKLRNHPHYPNHLRIISVKNSSVMGKTEASPMTVSI